MHKEVELEELAPKRAALEFEGQNGLVLRQLMDWDAQELLRLVNDNRGSFAEFAAELNAVVTEQDALLMIGNPKFSTFGIKQEKDGPLVGLITVQQETEDRVSIGFAVGENFKRQGIASNAIRTISDKLFKTPNIKTVRSYVKVKNRASRQLLEHCGFHRQGERPHVYVFYDLDKPKS